MQNEIKSALSFTCIAHNTGGDHDAKQTAKRRARDSKNIFGA